MNYNLYTDFIEVNNNKYIYNLYTGTLDMFEIENCISNYSKILSKRFYLNDDEFNTFYNTYNSISSNIKFGYKYYVAFNDICNAKCYYCFEEPINKYNTCDIEKLISMIDSKVKKNDTITLYGGEPFLKINKNNLEKIFSFCLKNNIYVEIISNGYYIDFYEYIIKNYYLIIKQITISMDGNKLYNDKIKGDNFFYKTIENVKILLKYNIKLNISINISNENKDKIMDLIHIINSINTNNITVILTPLKYIKNKVTLKDIYILNKIVRKVLSNNINLKIKSHYINRTINIFDNKINVLPIKVCEPEKEVVITDKEYYSCNENIYNNNFNVINDNRKYIKQCLKCKYNNICANNCIIENNFYNNKCFIYEELNEFIQYYLEDLINIYK